MSLLFNCHLHDFKKLLQENFLHNMLIDRFLRKLFFQDTSDSVIYLNRLPPEDVLLSAEIKTEFDESIGKINIVPQDIGSVLLNLFDNAFYASIKAKTCLAFVPVVTAVTQKQKG